MTASMRAMFGLVGAAAAVVGMSAWGAPARQEGDEARVEKQRCPKPTEFASGELLRFEQCRGRTVPAAL